MNVTTQTRRAFLHAVSLIAIAALGSSCASGRFHGEKRDRVRSTRSITKHDRVSAKQSSYRVRGTDQVGTLSAAQTRKLRAKTHAWRWPTNEVRITSRFGSRNGDYHDGIDLRASTGTKVYAASDGKVIYSGSKISGYGKMVVVRHAGKLSTIYAHNSKLYTKAGQKVRRGQLIALSGNTGRSSGPHVHFEVREGVTAINPSLLLPSPAVVNEANRRMMARRNQQRNERYSQSSSRRIANRNPAAKVASDDGFKPRSPRAQN